MLWIGREWGKQEKPTWRIVIVSSIGDLCVVNAVVH